MNKSIKPKVVVSINRELSHEIDEELSWEEEMLSVIKNIAPASFERLCQRLLRESGFSQVEITGRSGDCGIDGKGIIKIGGLLSFPIIFQCKRYKDKVTSGVIRDFRGAMIGRADKGLIITTGNFTHDAKKEANRDGASPIDLIDGEMLVRKLKDFGLGVEIKTEIVERVCIKKDWFESL